MTIRERHGRDPKDWTLEDRCKCGARDCDTRHALADVAAARAHAKALAEALRDANAEIGACSPTSGGTEGQWCVNHHDYRWLGAECELAATIRATLAAYDKDHEQ